MARIIAHIDLNAFFAACEVLRDPTLKDKPLIIGHRGRGGIVSTCSYEARKYGIHSGMPTFQAEKLCRHLIVKEPDYSYYKVMSNSFFAIVKEYTLLVEVASIDECFADFTEAMKGVKDPVSYFSKLQNDLYQRLGLSASIGVAPTKWLAKMASDMKKPMGLTFLRRRDLKKTLYPLPIESFWGIGKKTAPELRKLGIATIGDFAKKAEEEDPALKACLGKFFYQTKDWVFGKGSDTLDLEPFDPKSIGNSSTLDHDSSDYNEIKSVLESLCRSVSERAKKAHKVGSTITLTVKDTEGSFHLHSKARSFSPPTDDFFFLFEEAERLYKTFYEGKFMIRLVGVSLSRLENRAHTHRQMTIWEAIEEQEEDKTKELIAEMNRKFDKPILGRASEAKKGNEP